MMASPLNVLTLRPLRAQSDQPGPSDFFSALGKTVSPPSSGVDLQQQQQRGAVRGGGQGWTCSSMGVGGQSGGAGVDLQQGGGGQSGGQGGGQGWTCSNPGAGGRSGVDLQQQRGGGGAVRGGPAPASGGREGDRRWESCREVRVVVADDDLTIICSSKLNAS